MGSLSKSQYGRLPGRVVVARTFPVKNIPTDGVLKRKL
jgi:hypothetical protein